MEEIQKLTPKEAVRAYCTQCLGMKQFNTDHVRDCQGDHVKCPFFPYRLGKRPPVKVFRAFCIDCMGGYRDSVIDCPAPTCPAYPYRLGTNPALKGQVRGASLIKKRAKEGAGGQVYDQKSFFLHQGMSM